MKITEREQLVKTHDGTDLKTFIAMPDDNKPHPGVLVIMEIWGVTDFIRTVCRRLAEQGYVALAPHLYSRKEQFDLFTEENIMDAMRPFWALSPEKRGDQATVKELLSKASENSRKIVNAEGQLPTTGAHWLVCDGIVNFLCKINSKLFTEK